ncbi:disease resistance protein RPS2-like [Telopea speciosissima]|uniref:disease resistance protein RPS2-like n=1 Tax=Telopea speciosissima TaxID=54955 RepID=UPI001CC7EFF0|nr:disease resistance protein RPS2-like [Telopea speciosissima]
MDIVSSALGCCTPYVVDPIAAKFRVLRNLRENIEELGKTTGKLDARRRDERRKLEVAMNQEGVVASAEADLWFSQVDDALSNANNLRIEYQQRRGSCPNCFCWSSYEPSKRVLKVKQDVDKLYGEDPRSGWTVAPPRPIGRNMNIVSIEGQTATKKLKGEIIDAVIDDRCVVVGLYGMGGIGKTTILRHVHAHFRKTNHFESVIFTTVSFAPNFDEIRKQIAECFGLKNWQDDNDLKDKLSRQTRKYMLMLDDIWEPVDLEEIYIPMPKKGSGCKILTASRSKAVVTRFVTRFETKDVLRLIRVNKLQPDEAWNLFVKKTGEDITSRPAIEPLAKEVLKKCDGLPLAIIVIGGTMSTRETEGEWKDAIRELGQTSSNLEGMEEVFSILMYSFEKLEQIEQSLFLYCCLFPEDYFIRKDELVDFVICEETLSELHRLEEMKCHPKFIAKASDGIIEAPDTSEWHKATKISLMKNYLMESLPQLLDQCPRRHTLVLSHIYHIEYIPQVHFLDHMPVLRILDLSNCLMLKTLPSSISHLVNLRVLRLRGCMELQNLPPEIGMLVQLILLDLFDCYNLRELPVQMNRLNNLRSLDIEYTTMLKRIPRTVLSVLDKLEELNTIDSGLKWSTNGVEELSQLTRLTNISTGIRKTSVLRGFKPVLAHSKCIRKLHLQNCTIDPSILSDLLDLNGILKFMSCEGLTSVPTHAVESLEVRDCPDLRTLLIVEKVERNAAFETLKYLKLDRLDQLETICCGVPKPGCFSNLEQILIKACPNLKVLFTKGVTRLLQKLKWLKVYRCPQLVKIVSDEEDDDLEINAFPSLKEMHLCELPELTAICDLDLNWPSLTGVHVYLCPKLRRPPFGVQHANISLNDEISGEVTDSYLRLLRLEERREEQEKQRKDEDDNDDEEEEEEELISS